MVCVLNNGVEHRYGLKRVNVHGALERKPQHGSSVFNAHAAKNVNT